MKNEGEPIAFVVPEDGAIGWVDNWAIASGSQNEELAYAFINYMLSKDVQYTWASTGGPAPTNPGSSRSSGSRVRCRLRHGRGIPESPVFYDLSG